MYYSYPFMFSLFVSLYFKFEFIQYDNLCHLDGDVYIIHIKFDYWYD